ncbi:MAG: tetratricopeptide repeat protein, partial [Verrucomicrobiota bacterium]
IAHYKRTLKLAPKHTRAHFRLGLLLEKNRKNREAFHHLKKALDLDPQNPDVIEEYKRLKAIVERKTVF